MIAFDPEKHGFIRLQDFKLGGVVDVFEYQNHDLVDGVPDFCRLNSYLTKDSAYVTIWWGLLEPLYTESKFEPVIKRTGIKFSEQYEEQLFRGYIETSEEAETILFALRIGAQNSHHTPQTLSGGPDDLRCEPLTGLGAALPSQ